MRRSFLLLVLCVGLVFALSSLAHAATGNGGFGINNQNSVSLNATHDYWGSPTGPTVASNPGGKGQAITTNVLYAPFNTTTNTPAPSDWSLALVALVGLGVAEVVRRKARPAQQVSLD